ncbi:MAG: SurA N-terminal domain-containing protein, partial [Proteobacteria bacterium]|nr:SurA N-terminal domain-containing protein [Pseudomonadota bacterium]
MKIRNQSVYWPLAVLLALMLSFYSACSGKKEPTVEKVAVVNGTIIPLAEFNEELEQIKQRISQQGQQISDTELVELKNNLLEDLINQRLIYQESQNKGIQVAERLITDSFLAIKKRFPGEDEFKKALSETNLTEDTIKSKIKQGIAIKELLDTVIVQKITIPESETREFYDANPNLFKHPEQVKASHILIRLDPKADESQKVQAKQKIETIRQKIKNGEDFSALAKEFSEGPSSANGGE